MQYFDARPDGSPAVELRLWDALDQQPLAPFEYYASTDNTDLGSVLNQPGELAQLAKVISGNDARARLVIHAIDQYVADHEAMRAIAFCVDIAHANHGRTLQRGRPACTRGHQRHTTRTARARPSRAGRRRAQGSLHCRSLQRGIDIPKPTPAAPYAQPRARWCSNSSWAAGCGSDGKESCLVLDFVGRLRNDFRLICSTAQSPVSTVSS